MELDHDLEKILGVKLELEFKSMELDWIRTPKKVILLISNIYLQFFSRQALFFLMPLFNF